MVRPTTSQLGAYRLLERISVGGMAEIYRAQRVDGSARVVALKRILPHLARDAEFVQMFIDEARTAAQLDHPNICRVFEFGEDQGTHFLTMELIEGRDLKRVTEYYRLRGRPLPLPIALHIMSRTCDALDYAHRALGSDGRPLGLVHRDVTPQNILISFQGEVKLIDFGIAKAAHRLAQTQAGNIKGKLSYLAPEQLEGRSATHRSDLFACGIVLHELLTNSRLFAGDNDLITIDLVRRAVAPPPSRLNPALPRALDSVVLRALARNPEARHASAGELRDQLDAIAAETGNTGSTSQVVRWMNEVFAHDRVRASGTGKAPVSGSLLFPSAARSSGLRMLVDDLANELAPSAEVVISPATAGERSPRSGPEPAWIAAATTVEPPPRHSAATIPEPSAPGSEPRSTARATAAEQADDDARRDAMAHLEPIDFDDDSREVTVPRAAFPTPIAAVAAALPPRSDQTGPTASATATPPQRPTVPATATPSPPPPLEKLPSITRPDGSPAWAVNRSGPDPDTRRRRRSVVVALVAAILLLTAGGAVFTVLLLTPDNPSAGSARSHVTREARAAVSQTLADAAGPSPDRARDQRATVADHAVPDRHAPPRAPAPRPSPRPPRRATDAGAPAAITPPSSPRATGVGLLIIASKPWARVWVDGSDTGRNTPIPPGAPLRLGAGKHRVTLQVEERSFDFSVTIAAGSTTRLMQELPVKR